MSANSQQTERRRHYLAAMGIDQWVPRAPQASVPRVAETPLPVSGAERLPQQKEAKPQAGDWPSLQLRVEGCTACSLHETRTQTVFGVGNPDADWLFVGEAPGADEDKQGEPFVGRAGQLLNAMLFALGLQRSQVYIANVLKCRPPNNRDPLPEEVERCEPFLLQQISMIKPAIIVALGRHAAHSLLKTDQPLGRLRGNIHDYHGTPLVVTYHPAYLLRSPAEKSKAWSDLCLARSMMERA